jgi:hypothetical protein
MPIQVGTLHYCVFAFTVRARATLPLAIVGVSHAARIHRTVYVQQVCTMLNSGCYTNLAIVPCHANTVVLIHILTTATTASTIMSRQQRTS